MSNVSAAPIGALEIIVVVVVVVFLTLAMCFLLESQECEVIFRLVYVLL
jgi:hypothetical protein